MITKKEQFLEPFLKKDVPDIRPGDTIKVHQIIKERTAKGEEKKRIQIFEGIVLACKHGRGINATITVKRTIGGVEVERIFPIHSPSIKKIEVVNRAKVRRAKLYYLRGRSRRASRLKKSSMPENE